ncbi:MAG TPA: IS200/IS605 family transposase [Blastocatellia bacterium]|nr:IS200/IS605 family transposase [Blastocatellia bacterium]
MANTFSQIYIQTVFAVENRQSLIKLDFKEDLHKYITGILRNQDQKLIAINSMPDHLHILIGLKPAMALADLVREIKSDSTNFINEQKLVRGRFNWQEGYGAFSYGHSQLNTIVLYIQNQERHHQKQSFKDEYMTLLRKFDVAFDDKYVFKFLD